MTKDHRSVDAQMAQEILLDNPTFLREIVEMEHKGPKALPESVK